MSDYFGFVKLTCYHDRDWSVTELLEKAIGSTSVKSCPCWSGDTRPRSNDKLGGAYAHCGLASDLYGNLICITDFSGYDRTGGETQRESSNNWTDRASNTSSRG